mgnify:CR=1 FL=1
MDYKMEQDIIEVSYSDSVPSQVITIDLPHPPAIPHNQNVQSMLFPSDDHSLAPLQPNDSASRIECTQLEAKIPLYDSLETSNNNGNICSNNDTVEIQERSLDNSDEADENNTGHGSKSLTRFKWTKEKSQVAMNLVKHGCKPKLVSIAVGCSLRTAQKFVETVTPKMEGGTFKNYEIRRRGRKSKDVNQRLDAIREVLSKDSSKTQVEIAADLKVSNTTVCRDLKRIGASWREKRNADQPCKREGKRDRQSCNRKPPSLTNKNKTRARQKKDVAKRNDKDISETSNPAPMRVDTDH